MNIKVSTKYDMLFIHINNILHLQFVRSKFLGLQSWIAEDFGMYSIEITLEGGSIICEYDNFENWKEILKQLEEVIYYGKLISQK